jgi:hypothetical protein
MRVRELGRAACRKHAACNQFEIKRSVCVMVESHADADRASIGHNTSELERFLQQHDGSFPGLADARHHTLSGRVGARKLQFASSRLKVANFASSAGCLMLHQAQPRALRGWMTFMRS